jgi:hypothetical protein
MTTAPFRLERDPFDRLIFIDAEGQRHGPCVPVRAFPIAAPNEGVSLISAEGHELAWIARLDQVEPDLRELLQRELAQREFIPEVRAIRSVSTFSTPSIWEIDTDRGPTRLVLDGEEDIRRLPDGALLIADHHGVHYLVRDRRSLDRASRRWLERFL